MMAQAILLCGKICSGKTTYARELRRNRSRSMVLSCDELMLTMFPEGAGEHHDMLSERARQYLFDLSLELLASGVDVILDWGFWTREWRRKARAFYAEHGIDCELHYVDAPREVWLAHIQSRNEAVRSGTETAYFVDEALLAKLESRFEPPEQHEIDVLYHPE